MYQRHGAGVCRQHPSEYDQYIVIGDKDEITFGLRYFDQSGADSYFKLIPDADGLTWRYQNKQLPGHTIVASHNLTIEGADPDDPSITLNCAAGYVYAYPGKPGDTSALRRRCVPMAGRRFMPTQVRLVQPDGTWLLMQRLSFAGAQGLLARLQDRVYRVIEKHKPSGQIEYLQYYGDVTNDRASCQATAANMAVGNLCVIHTNDNIVAVFYYDQGRVQSLRYGLVEDHGDWLSNVVARNLPLSVSYQYSGVYLTRADTQNAEAYSYTKDRGRGGTELLSRVGNAVGEFVQGHAYLSNGMAETDVSPGGYLEYTYTLPGADNAYTLTTSVHDYSNGHTVEYISTKNSDGQFRIDSVSDPSGCANRPAAFTYRPDAGATVQAQPAQIGQEGMISQVWCSPVVAGLPAAPIVARARNWPTRVRPLSAAELLDSDGYGISSYEEYLYENEEFPGLQTAVVSGYSSLCTHGPNFGVSCGDTPMRPTSRTIYETDAGLVPRTIAREREGQTLISLNGDPVVQQRVTSTERTA